MSDAALVIFRPQIFVVGRPQKGKDAQFAVVDASQRFKVSIDQSAYICLGKGDERQQLGEIRQRDAQKRNCSSKGWECKIQQVLTEVFILPLGQVHIYRRSSDHGLAVLLFE